MIFTNALDTFKPVGRNQYIQVMPFELTLKQLYVDRLIIDDEDARLFLLAQNDGMPGLE